MSMFSIDKIQLNQTGNLGIANYVVSMETAAILTGS